MIIGTVQDVVLRLVMLCVCVCRVCVDRYALTVQLCILVSSFAGNGSLDVGVDESFAPTAPIEAAE